MSRGRFVLFYDASGVPDGSGPSERGSDSLLDLVTEACRLNLGAERGGRALRVERGGRVLLDEAALRVVAHRARATQQATLARNQSLSAVSLRDMVFCVMRDMGLIGGGGESISPRAVPDARGR